MMEDKMTEKKKPAFCKYYNSGYCKFHNECKFIHAKEVCSKPYCKSKKCFKRHPKNCRYGDKCKRRAECLFKHNAPTPHPLLPAPKTHNPLSVPLPLPSCPGPHTTKEGKDESDNTKLKEDINNIKLDLKGKQDFMLSLQNEIESLKEELSTLLEANKCCKTAEKIESLTKNVSFLFKNNKIEAENRTNQATKLMKKILTIEGRVNIITTTKPNQDPNPSSNTQSAHFDPKQHYTLSGFELECNHCKERYYLEKEIVLHIEQSHKP